MLAMLVIAVAGGCTVIRNEFRTLIAEPLKYGDNVDIVRTTKRNKKLAKEYFLQHFDADEAEWSPDFRDGFIEGFADYLTFGGTGAPPVAPPRRYWNLPDRSPAGQNAVQDWFAGFAAGASEAKVSGLRELQTVPSSYLPLERGGQSSGMEYEELAPPANETWESLPVPDDMPPPEQALPGDEPGADQLLPPLPPTNHGMYRPAALIEQATYETLAENESVSHSTEPVAGDGNPEDSAPTERSAPRIRQTLPRNVLRESRPPTSNVRLPVEQARDANTDHPQ